MPASSRSSAFSPTATSLVPTSVFFGGGTPSRLHPETLCRVLDAIPRAPGAEVTVECNPEDADEAHLGAYRRAGVTRVSFGLQSTHRHVLAGLGRRHVPHAAEIVSAAVVAAGFATLEPRPHPRRTGRERRRLGAHPRTRPRPRPPAAARLGLRPHRRARHASRAGSAAPPRRGRLGPPLRARRGDPHGGRVPLGGDLQLVPAGTRVPAQPSLLGAG